jgi:hypothetical protein
MFDFKADTSIDIALWKTFSFDDMFQKGNVYTDTGGGTWHILEQLQKKKMADCKNSLSWLNADPILKTFPEEIQAFLNTDLRNEGDKLFSEINHNNFIHLRGGGNWEIIYIKTNILDIQEQRYKSFLSTARALLDSSA